MVDNIARCNSSSHLVRGSIDVLNVVIQAKRNAPVSPSDRAVRPSVSWTVWDFLDW